MSVVINSVLFSSGCIVKVLPSGKSFNLWVYIHKWDHILSHDGHVVMSADLLGIVFSGDEINDGLNELGGRRGSVGVWGVQVHTWVGNLLL